MRRPSGSREQSGRARTSGGPGCGRSGRRPPWLPHGRRRRSRKWTPLACSPCLPYRSSSSSNGSSSSRSSFDSSSSGNRSSFESGSSGSRSNFESNSSSRSACHSCSRSRSHSRSHWRHQCSSSCHRQRWRWCQRLPAWRCCHSGWRTKSLRCVFAPAEHTRWRRFSEFAQASVVHGCYLSATAGAPLDMALHTCPAGPLCCSQPQALIAKFTALMLSNTLGKSRVGASCKEVSTLLRQCAMSQPLIMCCAGGRHDSAGVAGRVPAAGPRADAADAHRRGPPHAGRPVLARRHPAAVSRRAAPGGAAAAAAAAAGAAAGRLCVLCCVLLAV